MNNTFSLKQVSKTSNIVSNLILRQYKLDLMARFLKINSVNPNLKQDQVAKKLGCSSSTLQRYRQGLNMLPPFSIPPKSHKRKQKISNREHDLERPQMTSIDLKRPQTNDLKRHK